MNLPNSLTLVRIFLIPLLVVVLLTRFEGRMIFGVRKELIGTVIFLLAACTAWLDGYLARRRGQVTELGQLMDPLADKIMVCAGFIVLVGMSAKTHPFIVDMPDIPHVPRWLEVPGQDLLMPAWMVIIIVARELAITGLRGPHRFLPHAGDPLRFRNHPPGVGTSPDR